MHTLNNQLQLSPGRRAHYEIFLDIEHDSINANMDVSA